VDVLPSPLLGSRGVSWPSGVVLSMLILIYTVGVMPDSCLSPPLPGSFSPMLIGRMLFGAPLNAAIIESDRTRNFPSLTEDMAYITVNSANSNVTRSP